MIDPQQQQGFSRLLGFRYVVSAPHRISGLTAMNTPRHSAEARVLSFDWPDAVTDEWCHMHRLIEELSSVQTRLGTPLERPDDFIKIRDLGSHITETLDQLRPWIRNVTTTTKTP